MLPCLSVCFYTWVLGTGLRSSCLQGNHFSNWAISQALHFNSFEKKYICIKVISSAVLSWVFFFSLQRCCFLLSSYLCFWKQLDFHCFFFSFAQHLCSGIMCGWSGFCSSGQWCCWPSQRPLPHCHLFINHASGPYPVPSDISALSWALCLFQVVLVIGMKLLFSQGSIPERKWELFCVAVRR